MKYETLCNFNNNITILLIELSAAMSCDYARLRGFRKKIFPSFPCQRLLQPEFMFYQELWISISISSVRTLRE